MTGGRLHPLTLLFEALRVGRAFVLPALVGGLSAGGDQWERRLGWMVAILAVPALVAAAAKYASFRYTIQPDELVLDSGVLRRMRRVIPLARIQNIDVRQSALAQVFGVAELRVETAGGNQTEAVLAVLSRGDAEALRAELLRRRTLDVGAEAPDEPQARMLARLGVGDLALAGATANEAGLVAALLGGIFNLAVQLPIDFPEPEVDPATLVPGSPAMSLALLILGLVIFFLFVGWLFSVVNSVVRYHGFTLEHAGDALRKNYGLLSRHEGFVPLLRIQAARVEESLLRRQLRLATLKMETAGSGPGEQRRGGAEAFLPLARAPQVPGLIAELFPDFAYDRLRFHPVHPRSRRRAFIRYAFPVLATAAALAAVQDLQWLWLLALLPGAWLAAHLHYRHLAYALAPGYLIARSGFLNQITWIVPERKIQTLHLRQTPFQRRHRLASLLADTAAGQAVVVDLHQDTAAELLRELSRRVGARRAVARAAAEVAAG
jgi:putative membrane protein